jgi:tetratricopeptide (TPR) repeat protein
MKIADIRDPRLFQRLVHRLFVAERGSDFQVPDDSGGDRGNDGYDAARQILYAIYCPEKPDTADFRRKALSDLAKAATLATQPGYSISSWVFVTPSALREPLQAELRAAAAAHRFAVAFVSALHLEDLFRRYPYLRDEFPELEYPNVAEQLGAIRQLLESPQRSLSTGTAESTPAEATRASPEVPGIFLGLISPQLAALYEPAEKGDAAAIAALERYRMEALDTRDFLDATLLLLQVEGELNRYDRARELAEIGLSRASGAGLSAEVAVFASNVAFYKSMQLTNLEMEHEGNLHFTQMAGFPFQTVAQIQAAERPINTLRTEIATLFTQARTAALESNNLVAIHIAMVRQAMAATHRFWPLALRDKFRPEAQTKAAIGVLKSQMERSYEAAIRAARAMHDDARLGTAYGNFANDLRSFGDVERAREFAKHALDLSRRAGYDLQIEKTAQLLERLE